MGWRENMGILKSNPHIQKVQNIQKPPEQNPIVPFVGKIPKIKTASAPPGSSKVQKEYAREYTATDSEQLKKIPGLPEDLFQAPAVWIWEEKKTWTPDVCPARCRANGKCYGIAYFDHKPGKALDCQQDQCPWME